MWPFLDRRATWLTSDGMDRDDIKTKSNLFRIDGGERERERERERKKISLEKVSEHLLKPTSNLTSATSDPFMSRKPSLGYLESLRWSPIINSVCGRWVRINWELNLRSNTDQSHISTLEESSCSLFFFFFLHFFNVSISLLLHSTLSWNIHSDNSQTLLSFPAIYTLSFTYTTACKWESGWVYINKGNHVWKVICNLNVQLDLGHINSLVLLWWYMRLRD